LTPKAGSLMEDVRYEWRIRENRPKASDHSLWKPATNFRIGHRHISLVDSRNRGGP
jgi:hypothetical protein